ncbi:MAG: hypothetical protein KBG91_00940 [Syntrophomonadaceae bacterium]|jgi:hypothetical protein|nr:hypothetical protein [Syntrophomonadaceae bacterium]
MKARRNRATRAGGRAATEPEGDALESTVTRKGVRNDNRSGAVAEGHGLEAV